MSTHSCRSCCSAKASGITIYRYVMRPHHYRDRCMNILRRTALLNSPRVLDAPNFRSPVRASIQFLLAPLPNSKKFDSPIGQAICFRKLRGAASQYELEHEYFLSSLVQFNPSAPQPPCFPQVFSQNDQMRNQPPKHTARAPFAARSAPRWDWRTPRVPRAPLSANHKSYRGVPHGGGDCETRE